jgi:hypothetical protein
MPRSKNPDYIDWQKSQAKNVIISDLEDGVLSAYETAVSSEQAWDVYKNLPKFKDICFKQFKERLKDHRKAHMKKLEESIQEEDAFQHDCLLHPHNETHDRRGKLIFDHSPAKDLLCNDIKNGAYPLLSPMELWNLHPEYKLFDLMTFRQRIFQEIKRNKFINWCEMKWEQKEGGKEKRKRDYTFHY